MDLCKPKNDDSGFSVLGFWPVHSNLLQKLKYKGATSANMTSTRFFTISEIRPGELLFAMFLPP